MLADLLDFATRGGGFSKGTVDWWLSVDLGKSPELGCVRNSVLNRKMKKRSREKKVGKGNLEQRKGKGR